MRTLLSMLIMASVACPTALADDFPLSVNDEGLTVMATSDLPERDGELLLNADLTWENGYSWGSVGTVPPDFGGFGEGFVADGVVTGICAFLTTMPEYFNGELADIYVYDSDGTNPATVLSVTTGVEIGQPPMWPEVEVYDFDIEPTTVNGEFFVYLWGDFADGGGWFVAADHDGQGGLPRTKVVAGTGYPEGWQDPNVVWANIKSMGLGAYLDGNTTPAQSTTWGQVKALYQ